MNTESVSKRDLEDLRFQLNFQGQNYERQLSDLRANLEKTVKQHATEEVRFRMNSFLKSAALVVGLLGGLGVLGLLTKTIPDTVEARVKSSVQELTTNMVAGVKERADLVIQDVRDQTAKLGETVRDDTGSILKDAQTTAAALVDEVKQQAEEARALRDQARGGAWIVLQTDYGDADHYMGALKGSILCEDPSLRIETITSDNPDYDIGSAASVLFEASQHYPPGTVFLILVNPGATAADPVVLHTKNDLYFVGYDNGCLDIVARKFEVESIRVISNSHRTCSRAEAVGFAFPWLAPAAAWIARAPDQAAALADVGAPKSKYEWKLPEPRQAAPIENGLRGEIVQFDRFGNAWTNIPAEMVRTAGLRFQDNIRVKIGGQEFTCPFVERYGDVEPGKPLVVVYNGFLQFALNRDNFRNLYKVKRLTAVEVTSATN